MSDNIFDGIGSELASAPVENTNRPISPDKYHLSVVNAETRTSKSGKRYVSVQYRVEDGQPSANRRIFEIYMLEGHEVSVRISRKTLSVIFAANGHEGNLRDVSQLIGAHVYGEVIVEEGRDGYDDKNRVKWVNAWTGQETPVAGGSSSPEPDDFDVF